MTCGLSKSAGLAQDENTTAGGEQEFIAAATFTTSKPGYVFKKGVKGLGFYKDARAACNNAQAAHNGAAKLVRSLEEWDELQAADGRTYYYNKSSLTTQWEVPR